MKLRVVLSLTDTHQLDIDVEDPDIDAGDLKLAIFAAAKREFGEHDEMRIVSVEEVIDEEAPHVPTQ